MMLRHSTMEMVRNYLALAQADLDKNHKLATKFGWTRRDLDRLYLGFGFTITHGARHDMVKHPDYPRLRTTLPRHNTLATGYVEFAIKLIDELIALKEKSDGS